MSEEKNVVKVKSVDSHSRMIYMAASPDVVAKFKQFGSIEKIGDIGNLKFYVDRKYDFHEVLAKLRNF